MKAREPLAVAALAVLPIAPFASAAFGIDEPVFLAVAHRILVAPLDPFGFAMVWDSTGASEAARFNLNPPLLSYWLAPWLAAFGESETWLRVAVWPFALLAAFSFHAIASRARVDALRATALFLAAPAFVVLAATFQLDVAVGAWLLLSVSLLLRARASGAPRDELAAGCAAAVAGLTKYVGLAAIPLLGAGLALLPGSRRPRLGSWMRVVGIPVAALALWGLYTRAQYGFVHYAAGLALVGERGTSAAELASHVASLPIWYGGALAFPLLFFGLCLVRGRPRLEVAVIAGIAGAAVALYVLPIGRPLRRVPLDLGDGVLAALCFGAGLWCVGLALARGVAARSDPLDRFLALWAGGFAAFSLFVNWHVNAADALLIAPPLLLLWLRSPRLAPSPRAQWIVTAAALALSLGLVAADAAQRNAYRTAASQLAAAIGDAPGTRWQVGQWGFQHYLARVGFQPLVPGSARSPGSQLAPGDWVATARNVSQLDVAAYMERFTLKPVDRFVAESRLPLRTTNPDAGAGFYTHHGGYVPFAISRVPLDEIALGRVIGVPRE
ncbi:MAG TPA: glycosyltransferase family 39 protein [Myxococcota bacterium]|nr:glycosyltransferase family 39 protein [Myxococcota bacterium]